MRSAKVLTWDEARKFVFEANELLATIIDKLSPSKQYKFLRSTYLFGDSIVSNGEINIPSTDGKTLICQRNFPKDKHLSNSFSYSPILLGLLLTKSSEVFVTANERIIPLNLLMAGEMFGTFEAMDYLANIPTNPIWCVSAGVRSVFTLPKLSDNNGIQRLRIQYKLPASIRAKSISDHWKLFKAIVNSDPSQWSLDILFFGEEWLNKKNDPAWYDFYNFIYKKSWQQSQHAIKKIAFGLKWQDFIAAVSRKRLNPRPYLIDTVKHLFLISQKLIPGINCNYNQNEFIPTKFIQKALVDTYRLQHYHPTILHTSTISNLQKNIPIYYSMSLPTLLEGYPYDKTTSTIMSDLRDIKQLIDVLKSCSAETHDYFTLNNQFDYFHVDNDIFGDISSSRLLPKEDRFLQLLDNDNNKDFCYSSAFWRGCIRITQKST